MTPEFHRRSSFAASLLDAGVASFAAFASHQLIEENPELAERFAPDAAGAWRAHFTQRIHELAAALDLGQPQLFAGRMEWAAKAFRGRGVTDDALRTALGCLAAVLRVELPVPARGEIEPFLAAGLEAIGQGSDEEGLDPARAGDALALEYLLTVLEGDPQRATSRVLQAVDEGLEVRQAYLKVLLPAQREIGRMWHRDEAGVAEEHLVTATTQRLMAILSQRATPETSNGKTVVAAAVAGNIHDMGVRTVSDFFAMAGWKTLFLGADVPYTELVNAVHYFNADLVVLSATLSIQLGTLGQTIEALQRDDGSGPKILVGGEALAEVPELWRQLGADGYCGDVAQALERAAELVGP